MRVSVTKCWAQVSVVSKDPATVAQKEGSNYLWIITIIFSGHSLLWMSYIIVSQVLEAVYLPQTFFPVENYVSLEGARCQLSLCIFVGSLAPVIAEAQRYGRIPPNSSYSSLSSLNSVREMSNSAVCFQESISDFYWYYSGKDIIDESGQHNFSKALAVTKQIFNSLTEYIQVGANECRVGSRGNIFNLLVFCILQSIWMHTVHPVYSAPMLA